MLQDTLVALGTEFGRTPEIVAEHQDGRDHFPQAFSCLMAGGGIQAHPDGPAAGVIPSGAVCAPFMSLVP